MHSLTVLLVACFALCVLSVNAAPSTAKGTTLAEEESTTTQIQLFLERSANNGKTWVKRSTLNIRSGIPSAYRTRPCAATNSCPPATTISTIPVAETLETSEDRQELLRAERLLYRVIGDTPDSEVARISLPPCSIVRGFEPRSSKHIVLQEQFKLLVKSTASGNSAEGPELTFLGLQHLAPTNLHHSAASSAYSSTKGGQCDLDAVELFATVTVECSVSLLGPNVPLRVPDSSASAPLMVGGKAVNPEEAMKTAAGGEKAADGSEKKKDGVDERSFFEKYSTYILIGGAMLMMSMRGGPPPEAAKKGGEAAAVAAKK